MSTPLSEFTDLELYECVVTLAEFRATFAYFDKHDRGHISRDELGCMMRMLGTCPKEDDLQSMLNDLDTEGDLDRKIRRYKI